MINKNIVDATCQSCKLIKTWDHVIKFQATIPLRRQFIKDRVVELVRNKSDEVHVEEIIPFVEDILRYLKNEVYKEFEIN